MSSTMPAPPPRRPRLLPQNRKLRHLRGLSLRNLCFAPPPPPLARGGVARSADDADIPGPNHKKQPKMAALQESSSDSTALHTSRSSENLSARRMSGAGRGMQRRASLSNAHESPASRQKKLENLADEAVGDVFFSLHDVASPEEPIYISEMGERSANFDFRFFNLSTYDAAVARACRVLIRVWTRRPKHGSGRWSFLLEELVDLRRLRFISTTLNREYRPNALVFHLEDGVYSLDLPERVSEPRQHHPPPATTSSYGALMRLAHLEASLRDAEETQRAVATQMNDLIAAEGEGGDGDGDGDGAADAAEEGVALANKYLATQRRLNRQAERRRDELRAGLRARRDAIAAGRALQRSREEDVVSGRERLLASRRLLEDTEQQIRGQRRRICAELTDVFPITPVPGAPPLSFEICGVPLPNSVYDAAVARTIGEDALSAGLGLVALLTRHLQLYLGYPLPYAVAPVVGSRAYIRDDISHIPESSGGGGGGGKTGDKHSGGRREFPLFLPRGGSTTGQWRFEYAWFLLNKDIEALCAAQGLRVVDIRHTLPNIKYLLYVGSAGGDDELPERKRGGVRGLWAGRLGAAAGSHGTAALSSSSSSSPARLLAQDQHQGRGSRPGSADSEAHARRGDALRSAAVAEETRTSAAAAAVPWGLSGMGGVNPELSLPFRSPQAKFTLRTKGLRENVAS